MADLYIPELPEDCDTLTAALAYATAGWYVLPIRRNARKHPGSVVGGDWQHQSSREPEVIAAWFAGTDHGIALHVGRSGGLAFDVDYPDRVPDVLAAAIRDHTPPHQSTRTDVPGRGHYLFAMPEGRTLGNGTGRLGGAWGQIRGLNGVVIVEPSPHENADQGGRYAWQSVGPVPVLPDPVADLLDDASPAEDAATDAEVAEFLNAHVGNTRPELLPGWVTIYTRKVAAGESRHDRMVSVAVGAMKEARAGFIPARLAADTLHSVFVEAVGKPPIPGSQQKAARNGGRARSEYAGILAWAVAQANAADLEEIRRRVNEKMPPGPAVVDAAEIYDWFWTARPVLQHLHNFARARVAAPWAVLGVALVRAICTVQPSVKLPAIVGSRASLNLFLGLVGPSGSGKTIAKAVARDALDHGDRTIEDFPIGTGEGIAAAYMRLEKRPDEPPLLVQHRFRALFHADEIDGVKAISARNGATLLPVLRSAYSGETLGNQNADIHRRLPVARHSYRLGFIAGIQPARSAILLDDADSGTPQRFLWMPTIDPDAPDNPPAEPPRRLVEIPPAMRGEFGPLEIDVCLAAIDLIRGTHLARIRGGNGDLLDGHGLLTRLKVAAALGVLDRRLAVTDEDWQLAEVIMRISDHTRARCQTVLAEKAKQANEARAHTEGQRQVIVTETLEDAAVRRVARLTGRKLTHEWVARNDLRKMLAGRDRIYFDAAIDRLVEAGQIEVDDTDRSVDGYGGQGVCYRLAEGPK